MEIIYYIHSPLCLTDFPMLSNHWGFQISVERSMCTLWSLSCGIGLRESLHPKPYLTWKPGDSEDHTLLIDRLLKVLYSINENSQVNMVSLLSLLPNNPFLIHLIEMGRSIYHKSDSSRLRSLFSWTNTSSRGDVLDRRYGYLCTPMNNESTGGCPGPSGLTGNIST